MVVPINKLSYIRGKVVPAEEATISIQTHSMQYGTAVFGGLRGYYNQENDNVYMFRLRDHFKRLIQSTKIMQLSFDKTVDELCEITLNLVKQSGYKENIYIRPIVYTSSLELSPRFKDLPTDIAIYILCLNDYLDINKGLKTGVSTWRRIDDTVIPTFAKAAGGYVNSALAKSEAGQNGFDEAIFLDSRGFVSEGSACNIFLVRDSVLITPSLSSSLLEGITRRSILQIAKELGISIVERDVSRSELYIADEVFFSGTGVQVAWVKEIDRRTVGEGLCGPITKKLQNLFFEIATGKNSTYSSWLTPVY